MLRPERVTLEGRVVRLEPLEERHRDDLLAAGADPEIWRYMGTVLTGPEDWDAYLAHALGPEFVAWATVDKASGRAIGSTRFGDIDVESDRVEIGWTWITPDFQRTAVNTEAKLLQLSYAFETLGAGRVALKTDGRNERSQAAIARLGAVREGTLRRHMRLPDGHVRDTVYFSILSDEWPAVKARLIERLAAG
ncbi:MAG TPA: GNAT family protein [Candidatus Limnocylindria bacterium]|jgi:RimJ/RimL family protein N-acetyltransferase